METLKDRFKKARKQAGLTQAALAEGAGISVRSVNKYEQDPSKITIDILMAIATACNVDITWLLTGTGDVGNKVQGAEDISAKCTNIVEFEHMELIKKFKDKEKGKLYNEQLIELEELSSDLFLDVGTYLNATLNAAKRVLSNGSNQQGRGVGKNTEEKKKIG